MRSVRGRSLGWLCVLAALSSLLSGCRLLRPHLDQSLLKYKDSASNPTRLAEQYIVHFPDILAVQVADRPSLSGERPVRVDGRIELTPADRIRVEGKTVGALGSLLAEHLGCSSDKITVSVTAY